jgi:metal-responsive CopG/Arc/MetJ family transcriptional regulator
MKIVHTLGMNMQRLTISMPASIYEQVLAIVGKGKVSEFIAEAAEAKVLEERAVVQENPTDRLFALSEKMPKMTVKQIKAAINKGRI